MTNPSQTLIPFKARELASIQRYGDWLTQQVAQVLAARFSHHNRDGSVFVPRIIESLTFPPYYHVVVLDPEALWHISKEKMIAQDTLDALTGAVQRLVRPITRIPDEAGRVRHGIAYAVLLRDLPHEDAGTRLPRVVRLDLGACDRRGKLQVPVGLSAHGEVWCALSDLGHALIVGTTGSGKSTFIHSALAALLSQNTPDDVRVGLVDPKGSELTVWARARHLYAPVATTIEQSAQLLRDIVSEMDQRGKLLARELVRDVRTYNSRPGVQKIPYLLIILDECLDVVLTGGACITQPLKTIAIRGRSVGVSLWAATQHASALTGLPRVVSVNLATRLVFRVTDPSAAQVAGCPRAHEIPTTIPGRMWAKLNDTPVLMQAYSLGDDDLAAVAQSVSSSQPSTVSSQVSVEHTLLEWAIGQGGGYLGLEDIMRTARVGQREARRIAGRMERAGWLVKDPTHQNKRRVCQNISLLVGGGVTPKADKLTD